MTFFCSTQTANSAYSSSYK